MSFQDSVAKALAMVARDMNASINSIQEYAEQVEAFKAVCELPVKEDEYAIRYRSDIAIKREDLPALRKAIGRVTVVGKNVSQYSSEPNTISVTLKPLSSNFSKLRFTYKTKLRNGGKCKIVEQVSTYKTLVCST